MCFLPHKDVFFQVVLYCCVAHHYEFSRGAVLHFQKRRVRMILKVEDGLIKLFFSDAYSRIVRL